MSDYLLMIGETQERPDPGALAERLEAHAAYRRRLDASAALLDAGRLHASSEGKRVRLRGADVVVEDGPFDGALASYYLVRAGGLDAATGLAGDCPLAPAEQLDVRPLAKGHVPPGMLERPGKVFAFWVLGAAADEPTWNQLMDRIDDDTKDRFPAEHAAGGMRLTSPSTGRRIAWVKGKRAVIDGPFLESKEVIGGLFFLRMASMDDAVRWASTTGFAVHGALEIRELWRT